MLRDRGLKAGRLREEARRQVRDTADEDWEAWGEFPSDAVEAFLDALVIGWPQREAQTHTVLGQLLAESAGRMEDVFAGLREYAYDLEGRRGGPLGFGVLG